MYIPRVGQAMRQYGGLQEDDVGDRRTAALLLCRLGERSQDLGGVAKVGSHPIHMVSSRSLNFLLIVMHKYHH